METNGFFQFEIIINVLVCSFRLIWTSILILSVRGPSSYVYRRQILTYKDGHRAERVDTHTSMSCRYGWSRKTATRDIAGKRDQFHIATYIIAQNYTVKTT